MGEDGEKIFSEESEGRESPGFPAFTDGPTESMETTESPDETEPGWFGRRRKRSYFRPSFSTYKDARQGFVDSGLVVLTDMTLDSRPCEKEIRKCGSPFSSPYPRILKKDRSSTSIPKSSLAGFIRDH